jgi:hypothetical protein
MTGTMMAYKKMSVNTAIPTVSCMNHFELRKDAFRPPRPAREADRRKKSIVRDVLLGPRANESMMFFIVAEDSNRL